MKRYETYKDSGIQWVGMIPEHWNAVPLKYNLSLKGRIGWNGLKSDEFKEKSYAYLVTGQDFIKADIEWSKCYQIDKERYDEDPFIQLENGDLLVTKDGTIGKIAKVSGLDKPACLNSGIFVVKPKRKVFIQNFLYWTFVSNQLIDFNNFNSTGSTIQHLYQNVFENMPLLIPSIEEQQAIASYLDYKIGQIDAAIAEKDQMLEDLKAYRSAIISEAVTKGLDKDVEMKNCGIEWLDMIPRHWKILPFKRMFSFGRGLSITKADLVEEGIPVISYGQIHSKQNTGTKVEQHLLRFVPDSLGEGNESSKVNKGDFIFADTSEDLEGCGNCVYIDNDYLLYAGYHSIIAKSLQSSDNKYFAYLFKTDNWRSQIRSSVNGVKVFSITQNSLANTEVILPPISEQQAISSYLDNKVNCIDISVKEIESQIEDLKAYRSSLITEAVTGKVDLRDWKLNKQ